VLAQRTPDRLFIGVDANAAGLRQTSGRAARGGPANTLFVRAAVEALPAELASVADQVTVILPWGSLLAAVAVPSVPLLQGIRRLCQPEARLTVVMGVDPARDQAEAARLGLPALDAAHFAGPLRAGYAEAGLVVTGVRPLAAAQLAGWPSTWARTLAHGHARTVFQLEARRC
jgi:16S rRNA (adenine(1408)-N(1))-methyltransferase